MSKSKDDTNTKVRLPSSSLELLFSCSQLSSVFCLGLSLVKINTRIAACYKAFLVELRAHCGKRSCTFEVMNLNECMDLQQGPHMNLIQWLQRCSLLANPLQCAQCNHDMVLIQRNGNHLDGFHW